jgi:hypothetical protein
MSYLVLSSFSANSFVSPRGTRTLARNLEIVYSIKCRSRRHTYQIMKGIAFIYAWELLSILDALAAPVQEVQKVGDSPQEAGCMGDQTDHEVARGGKFVEMAGMDRDSLGLQ